MTPLPLLFRLLLLLLLLTFSPSPSRFFFHQQIISQKEKKQRKKHPDLFCSPRSTLRCPSFHFLHTRRRISKTRGAAGSCSTKNNFTSALSALKNTLSRVGREGDWRGGLLCGRRVVAGGGGGLDRSCQCLCLGRHSLPTHG